MTAGRGIRKWVALALVAAGVMTYLLATTFAGSATAQSGSNYASITGAAFTPEESGCMAYDRNGYSGEFEDDDGCNFSGGIQLPNGAVVTGVIAFYEPNGASADLHLEESGPFAGHTDIAVLNLNDCGSSQCVRSVFAPHLSSPDVNNLHFGYAAWVSPECCGFTLYRVVVRYTTNAAAAVSPTSLPKGGTAVNNP